MDDCKIKKMFFFYIFIFILFDTSMTFYASMFCDSGPYMQCRLCDSFFHIFLPTLVKMGSSDPPLLLVKRVGSRSGPTFCRSWVQYFCKWYQLATLYCITFCRCFKVSGTLRLLVRDSTPTQCLNMLSEYRMYANYTFTKRMQLHVRRRN